MPASPFRLAAVADLHLSGGDPDVSKMRALFRAATAAADVLVICGDFTCHGRPDELRGLFEARAELDIPAVYAPIADTLEGEPEGIWPFLGSSRFGARIDMRQATVAFHGHAHLGTEMGRTDGGVPVFNVALPVLARHAVDLRIWSLPDPAADAAEAAAETDTISLERAAR